MGMRRFAPPASAQIDRVAITFDDGFASVFLLAYPYMSARGMKATVYVTKDFIGTAGYMTEANLKTLYTAGWDISNHSETHTNFITLTQGQIETDITNCKMWLDGLGLTRASAHVAYPFGGYDVDTEEAMVALGLSSGRITGATSGFDYANGIESLTQIPCQDTGTGWSNTLVASVTISSIRSHAHVLLWHELLSSGPIVEAYEMLESDFQSAMDFILARNITTVTISELYGLL